MELKIELDTYHDDYYRFPGCFFDFVIFSMFLALILITFFKKRYKRFSKISQISEKSEFSDVNAIVMYQNFDVP